MLEREEEVMAAFEDEHLLEPLSAFGFDGDGYLVHGVQTCSYIQSFDSSIAPLLNSLA